VVVSCIDTELGVQLFDGEGRYRRGFGVHDIGAGRFSAPTGIHVTRDGDIWVVDSVRGNLQVFDATGGYRGAIEGAAASEPWLYPSALAGDGLGLFAMAEAGGNRLRLLWVEPAKTSTTHTIEETVEK